MNDEAQGIMRNIALGHAMKSYAGQPADDVLKAARQFEAYLTGKDNRVEVLENALREINVELTIPAAEYVPAIPAAWAIIEKALGVKQVAS